MKVLFKKSNAAASRRFRGLVVWMFISVAIFLQGCGSAPDKRTITGQVRSEDGSGLSGVRIEVYRLTNADNDWDDMRTKAPGTGTDKTESLTFDPRGNSLLGSTTSDESGNFALDFTSDRSEFNLFLSKGGRGWKYLFNKPAARVGEITMPREDTLQSLVAIAAGQTVYTFAAGKSYYISDDAYLLEPVENTMKVVFEKGCMIRFKDGKSLLIGAKGVEMNGTADEPVIFTSASTNARSGSWNTLEIGRTLGDVPDGVRVRYARFDFASTGLSVGDASTVGVSNAAFTSDEFAGLSVIGGGSLTVENSVFSKMTRLGIDANSQTGLCRFSRNVFRNSARGAASTGAASAALDSNICLSNTEFGLETFATPDARLRNNFVRKCVTGLLLNNTTASVSGNTVETSSNIGIAFESSRGLVSTNTLTGCTYAVAIQFVQSPPGSPPSDMLNTGYGVSQNNLSSNSVAILNTNPKSFNVTSNYWGVANPASIITIASFLTDENNQPVTAATNPVLSQPVINAGAR